MLFGRREKEKKLNGQSGIISQKCVENWYIGEECAIFSLTERSTILLFTFFLSPPVATLEEQFKKSNVAASGMRTC